MRYEGKIYRPPSEAGSLLIQVTYGCSHNKCTFCGMFKTTSFRIRPIEDVMTDLKTARSRYPHVRRIYLIDGDALVLKTEHIASILTYIKELFPECERVGMAATSMDILRKTPEQLTYLHSLGLNIIYLGVETGSDTLLKKINKGVTADQIIEAGIKIKKSGMKLSVSLISGLGGKALWEDHAIGTARVLNAINPDYLGLLTLVIEDEAPMKHDIASGEMTLLTPREVLLETKLLVEHLDLKNSLFRNNHASNYLPFKATLGSEKERLLQDIRDAIDHTTAFKDDLFRQV